MQNRITYKLIGTCLVVFTASLLHAQQMNSPYSIYGIGDIDHRVYGRSSGMGGTSIALRSSSYILNNNPASLAGLPRSVLVINAMGTGRVSTYKGDPIDLDNNKNQDFWVKGISIGVKLNNAWASNIGFSQFSNVNYKFTGSQFGEGSTNVYATAYEGNGGINEYYWANSLSIGKHFTAGVKASWLSGSVNQTESVYNDILQTTISTKQQDYFTNSRFQFGALYTTNLGGKKKKWDLTLGGKYIPNVKLGADRTLTVTQDDVEIVSDQYVKNDRFWLPTTYGAGIALQHNKKTTFAVDYTYEDWNSLGVKGSGWRFVNSQKLSAGVEFSKSVSSLFGPTEQRFFQLGGFINNSHLQVRNNRINEFGVTAGMGGSLGRGLLYSLSGEYGVRGTTDMNLIKENYFQFTMTLSFREILFSKGRKYN
jgi:hypothetical protein